jgi:GNAT superfamily N-acetyltransferase
VSFEIIHLTTDSPDLAVWLGRAEPLHRMLRPQMVPGYEAMMARILADGAQMALAHEGGAVRALAVFRAFHNTWNGYRFYVDDLVTDEARRSAGYGGMLLRWCEDLARSWGCAALTLESGVQRGQAHRFYFREGMIVEAFSFVKPLADL